MKFTKLDYCQYLISSQINYTLTNLADHLETISHDKINSYLRKEKLTPRLLWDNVKEIIPINAQAYIIFDDTVLDKRYSEEIELVRRQYSGNEHRVLRGIGLINCVYVNSETGQFWVIDYRIYDPDGDGKSKLDHVIEMLQALVYHKMLPFSTVLMDSWYATTKVMQYIDNLGKYYYCPLKKNRLVDDTAGQKNYQAIEALHWSQTELDKGKIIKIKSFYKHKKVKLFRVIVSTDKTEFIVTNDFTQDSTDIVQQVCNIRWKIEEFHRELKQLTGIESCQCRKARIQRNHIGACMLVWLRLKDLAYKTGQTIYQLKYGLLSNYLIQQLKRPVLPMFLV
ncbi:transposase [Nostoc sp. CHAB 5715]|uniref:IS701 family transposase n=1 Tax=Nostoc sp. CHAB 5715 TaxID=2780400 RepID=UPI001E4FC23C|nr:transposase [Nostoc sp. CHAB 5715]MCC5620719.1 transposase [Nostoc sp. CHAB 5715]